MQKAQRMTHTYMMCKPTHTYLIAQDNQVGSTTYTNTCKEQNQNMQGGQVTFNVNNLSTSYRKEAHWI